MAYATETQFADERYEAARLIFDAAARKFVNQKQWGTMAAYDAGRAEFIEAADAWAEVFIGGVRA
jgi:hypothetical protein